VQLRTVLEQELRSRNGSDTARCRAHDIHRRLYDDNGGDHPPLFTRVSQNVATMAIHLRMMPEPSTMEGRQAHKELRALLEHATVQQS
jgi:hypothetical protein